MKPIMKHIKLSCLIILAAVLSISAGLAVQKGFELPSVHELKPLTIDEIRQRAEAEDYNNLLIAFSIRSEVFQYKGYIFGDGKCFLSDSVYSRDAKDYVADAKRIGNTWNLSNEYIQIVEDAPDAMYYRYYEAELSNDKIQDLLYLLTSQEIYVFEPGIIMSDTGISFALNLYMGNKIAGYRGDLLSGFNGNQESSFEGDNIALYEYLQGVLIPGIRETGSEIEDPSEYDNRVTENIERYPYALIYDKEKPDKLISGDTSAWEAE